jgi:predicted ATPase/DNA-binding SARP family transcriptional activator
MAIDIRLLGPLELRSASSSTNAPIPLGGPRQRTLLGLLALRTPDVVSRDQLIDGIWDDDPPAGAGKTLLAHVAYLRRSLAAAGLADAIRTRPPGYALTAAPEQVDAYRFDELVRRGRAALAAGAPDEAADTLAAALRMWRGEVLADCPLGDWPRAEAARLREARRYAAEDLLAARLRLGDYPAVAAELEGMVAREPLRERLWELLMVALYRCDRQGDALAAFHRARAALAEELGIEPGPALRGAQAAILAGDDPVGTAIGQPAPARPEITLGTGELPAPLTSLIGRHAEIDELSRMLGERRLVTLTGVGGCGKTRLAVAVAGAIGPRFEAGVSFVDLTSAGDSVPAHVAAALGIRERSDTPAPDLLARHLRSARLLLVLDNCEHVVDGCAELAGALLSRCPELCVLATSREALGVAGELVWPVPALSVPPSGAADLAAVRRSDAVRLFLDRAAVPAVRALTDADAPALAAICTGLDGLPLALELAAARTSVLTVPEIAERLRDPALLRGAQRGRRPHHDALDATMAWSYRLLDPPVRSRFRQLSVFAGGFMRDAAQAVWTGTPDQALESLRDLVAKSLVVMEPRLGVARYRLLETIRHYAAGQLADTEEWYRACRNHAVHFGQLAEEIDAHLHGPQLETLLDRFAADEGNMLSALAWYAEHGTGSEELRLANALARYFHLRGRYRDGRRCLEHALLRGAEAPLADRAQALVRAAFLALFECDYAAAARHGEPALELYRELGDLPGIGRSLSLLASVDRECGRYERSRYRGKEAVEVYREAGDDAGSADALQLSGFVAWLTGDLTEAEELVADAHKRFQVLDDPEGIASARIHLAAIAYHRDEPARARWLAQDTLARSIALDYQEGIAWSRNILGLVAHRDGEPEQAVAELVASLEVHSELGDRWRGASVLEALAAVLAPRAAATAVELVAAASAIRDSIGAPVPPQERPAVDAALTTVHNVLGDREFYEAWARGEARRLADIPIAIRAQPAGDAVPA